jgi:hypothetical protein
MRKLHLIVIAAAVALCAFVEPLRDFKTDYESVTPLLLAYKEAIDTGGDTTAAKNNLESAIAIVRAYGNLDAKLDATYGAGWKADSKYCKQACQYFSLGCFQTPVPPQSCLDAWYVCFFYCKAAHGEL